MQGYVIHGERRLLEGFFDVDEVRVSFRHRNGSLSEPICRIVLRRPDVAAAILHDPDRGIVVLSEQFRLPTAYQGGDGWITELVAGVVEDGETPSQCVCREIREETGYEAEEIQEILTYYPCPGASTERVHLFYARVSTAGVAEWSSLTVSEETVVPIEFSEEALLDSLDKFRFQDPKVLLAGHWLRERVLQSGME